MTSKKKFKDIIWKCSAYGVGKRDADWLIARVQVLTEALEKLQFIKGHTDINAVTEIAREALEENHG